MNEPIYLGQPILDISKTLMYEFWYDYIKPKHKEKAQLCYMDMDGFIIDIKTEDFYKDIAKDVNKWFDTSGYDKNDNRSLPIGKNKKVIGKFKDELNGMIMIKFCEPRAKTYPYLLDDDTEKKKAKGTKNCVIKHCLKFNDYKDSIFNKKTTLRLQQRFKSDHYTIYTKDVNKIAISSNDDKRLQTNNKITTYPYATPAIKVCESELLSLIFKVKKKSIILEWEYLYQK